MGPWEALLVVVGGAAAGALNAVAGGGSLVNLTTLMFAGFSPVAATMASAVGLLPAAVASAVGYRRELPSVKRQLLWLTPIAAAGSVFGALTLVRTPDSVFERLVPVLILVATLAFARGEWLRQKLGQKEPAPAWVVALVQLGISIYGGYFNGGMGLMMLASLALLGMTRLHEMNAVKSVLAVAINAVSVTVFLLSGTVQPLPAALVATGGVVGGYAAATFARKSDAARVKRLVVWFGVLLSAAFTLRVLLRS